MITCIRDIRRAKGLTLQEVADRCVPPTTAQTIGRLETGTRAPSRSAGSTASPVHSASRRAIS